MSCQHLDQSNIELNIENRDIYKDECAKCFKNAVSHSQEDEYGIDVCLKCFVGGCARHSQDHQDKLGHPIAVNIKAIKIIVEQPESQQITKLAIGKAGGASYAPEEWEFHTTAKCLKCNLDLEKTPYLITLIDSILVAQSAFYKEQIAEWELEHHPCEHTRNLQQNPVQIESKSLAHCKNCDLNSNLWLCMTCGNIGCGRRYFDGTGGNNHGVEHTQTSGHKVAVKLGTITPEGKAAVHCYACEDEVIDENLAEHLASFGIMVQSQVKTEKTQAELELEASLNLQLSKAVEDGKILRPLYGSGFTGMENLGNSCYMNSIMQVLLSLDQWKNRFFDPEHLDSCMSESPKCFHCQMIKLNMALHSGEHSVQKFTTPVELIPGSFTDSVEYQDGVKPRMFKVCMGKDHVEFSTGRQQDALEYFQHIMTLTERAEKAIQNTANDPSKVFNLKEVSTLRCGSCNGVNYRSGKQSQITVSVPIDASQDSKELMVPWADVLKTYTEPVEVDYNCPRCQRATKFYKTQAIENFPSVLVVVVQRFVAHDWVPTKLECGVQVPTDQISLESLRFHKGPEEELPDAEVAQPQINQEFIATITSMGFSENQAKHAIVNTQNSSAEAAMEWLISNMDDPSILLPLESEGGASDVSQDQIMILMSMGFTESQARYGLSKCDNSVERAIDYLFNHQDDMEEDPQPEITDTQPANYQLHATVTHLGASVHSGHYVCHIKHGDEWVLYNDAKVAASSEPPLHMAYVYFFKRV